MKIYPGKHQLVQTQEVIPNIDIPLAYIDTITSNYEVNITPKTSSQGISEVVPYMTFDSQNVCLFNAYGEIVDNTSILQRDSQDKYVYVPKDAIDFVPEFFTYTVTGKKKISYASQKIYNLKVGCIDTPPDLLFAKNLIKVFGDAPKRNVAPNNIQINNMDLAIESLINSSIKENDFVFIESADCKTYPNNNPIDFNSFLDANTNIWLSADDYSDFPMVTLEQSTEIKVAMPKILNALSYTVTKAFAVNQYVGQNYTIHNIFEGDFAPILILEAPNKAFVVISPKEFLNNIEQNVNLFYEILMYVYSNTYISVAGPSEWITDKVPDYVVLNNKLIKKDNFLSLFSLSKIFNLSPDEVSLINIDVKNSSGESIAYIKYVGITNDYILFDKEPIENHFDPEKPDGHISIFTPRQTIIYFKTMLYLIEDNIQNKLSYQYEGFNLLLTISSFKSSINGINIDESTTLTVPLTKVVDYKEKTADHLDLYLCCKNNLLSTIDMNDYTADKGIIVAEIRVNLIDQNKAEIFDIRQRGGGLVESQDPNYELLDIGNVFGRPYRETGTLVITMPKRLEPYEDLILKAVKKHMLAEDLPIILFE